MTFKIVWGTVVPITQFIFQEQEHSNASSPKIHYHTYEVWTDDWWCMIMGLYTDPSLNLVLWYWKQKDFLRAMFIWLKKLNVFVPYTVIIATLVPTLRFWDITPKPYNLILQFNPLTIETTGAIVGILDKPIRKL